MATDTKPVIESDGNWVSPEQQEQAAAAPVLQESTPVPAEVINFYQRYNLAMQGWVKAHGNTNFPIAEVKQVDGSTKLVWVNREARKKIRKSRRSTSK